MLRFRKSVTVALVPFLAGLTLALGSVCVAAPMSEEPEDSAETVATAVEYQDSVFYVTNTGDKYHRDGCDLLKDSKIPMTLEEIAESAYMPCRLCRPDSERRYPALGDSVAIDQMPIAVRKAAPAYPQKAELTGTEGTVWVQALINWEGEVVDARIAKASGTNVGFEDAALKAAYEFRYKPAMKDGHPVAIWVTYPMRFALKK